MPPDGPSLVPHMSWIPRPCPKPARTVKRVAKPRGQRAKRSGGHLFEKLVSQPRRSWIRQQACVALGVKAGDVVTVKPWMPASLRALCPYRARIVVAHVKSRGAGGSDAGNVVPLEAMLHELQGQWGWKTFCKRLSLMPAVELAALVEDRYLARAAAIAKNLEKP